MQFHVPEVASQHRHLLEPLLEELHRFAWEEVACPVCGEAERRSLAYERFTVQVQRCGSCEHLYVSPRMPAEAIPVLYGSSYWHDVMLAMGCPPLEERIQFDYDNALGKLNRDVLPFRQSGRLLDIGGSNGGVVRRAGEMGFRAAGLEPSGEICDLARRTHGVVMFEGTLAQRAFPDASWDVVLMHDVLEHLLEPRDELREIRRILAPGGFLAIETLSSASLNLADDGTEWTLMNPIEHVNFPDERAGARMLREAGFRILDLYSPHENNWIAYAEAA